MKNMKNVKVFRSVAFTFVTLFTVSVVLVARPPVEILKATGGLPAHIAGRFADPVRFVETKAGEFLVLDRRGHTVYGVDRARTTVRKILQVGFEQGQLLRPAVLAISADDIFAVADAPSGMERIQYFGTDGTAIGGFYLPSRALPRLTIGPLVLNGVGSMEFTGKTFLINQPESGALVSELDVHGRVLRHFGLLRATGHESDRDVHVTLNVGLPLVDPRGGFYFVFQTGRPMFRKYDANGTLVFERHIEGLEIDGQIQSLPTTWPRRTDERSVPLVSPLVRTAAVDSSGRLWVSLVVPFTYVYDTGGDKTRIVQFQAAGLIAPTSLFFAPRDRVLVTPGCYEFPVR